MPWQAASGQPALDVRLSLEETYADVAPVRELGNGVSAFVSIMRGCNNMCAPRPTRRARTASRRAPRAAPKPRWLPPTLTTHGVPLGAYSTRLPPPRAQPRW